MAKKKKATSLPSKKGKVKTKSLKVKKIKNSTVTEAPAPVVPETKSNWFLSLIRKTFGHG